MICASLSGAGRKGGTPRPLSGAERAVLPTAERNSESDWDESDSNGTDGSPARSEEAPVAGTGSSGLRRLNKTLYH
jgi:hypothetical protein